MSANGWFQFAIYSLILLATVKPVGIYLTRVFEGQRTWLDPVLRPCERFIYRLCGAGDRGALGEHPLSVSHAQNRP